MPTLSPQSFRIDSGLQLIVDQFDVDVPGAARWLAASPSDSMNIEAGLHDIETNTDFVSGRMVNGHVDEYELMVTPRNIKTIIRGRDPGYILLESSYSARYIRNAALQPIGSITIRNSIITDAHIPLDTPRTFYGPVLASKIARDAVTSVGLTLLWQCPDYSVLIDYTANGRIIDTIHDLVSPWNVTENRRVDIFVSGGTVIVRQRTTSPVQTLTIDVQTARWKTISIIKKRLPKIFKLVLRGAHLVLPDGTIATDPDNPFLGLSFGSSGYETTVNSSAETDVSDTTSEDTYRMPDGILLSYVKRTYVSGVLVQQSNMTSVWESSNYDANGQPLNQPLQFSQEVVTSETDPDDNTFKVMQTQTIKFEYDGDRFMTAQTTVTKERQDGVLKNSALTVRTLHDHGALMYEEIVEEYTFDSDEKAQLVLRRSSVSPGRRPGGPNRSSGSSLPALSPIVMVYFLDPNTNTLVRFFGSSPPVEGLGLVQEFSNASMTVSMLTTIAGLFSGISGKTEVEIRAQGLAIPWIERGTIILITGLKDETGSAITLKPALVTSIRHRQSAAKGDASALADISAVYWE